MKLIPNKKIIVSKRYNKDIKSSTVTLLTVSSNNNSLLGEIVEVGSEVEEYKVGDLILVPLDSIKSVIGGDEYFITHENGVYLKVQA
jgi:hypothetical protein